MENGTPYTLALWRVKEGKEEEFVLAWKGDLADYFWGLPNPPGELGRLIRSVEDSRLFYSFGSWQSLEDIQEMRSNPALQR
jgi:heme-degrading monooxygenase HmoA